MLEGDAGRGAGPLPPDSRHDEFIELCAIATTGSIGAEERRRLRAHLSHCTSCREVMAQYETIVGHVLPAWAEESLAEGDSSRASDEWDIDQAERRLFAQLEEENPSGDPNAVRKPHSGHSPLLTTPKPVAPRLWTLWAHLWGQFAAGILLVAMIAAMTYRIGIRRGTEVASQAAPTPVSHSQLTSDRADGGRTPAVSPATTGNGVSGREIAALRAQLEARLSEIDHLKTELAKSEKSRSLDEAQRVQFFQDHQTLTQQLEAAQHDLEDTREKLSSATSQENATNQALEQNVDQLNASVRERDQEVTRERQLLDKDRDIRELMGSRDLYIAEVYDVAKTGDTEKPFGRVFYTKGKSLIFYAYDLDQQPGLRDASTFQAWGRVGQDRDRAVNLGILYQDNANRKRWVVKSDNPRTLAEIDAVFVTVEPNGGSAHPSGKPLLFAYLKIQPNHP